MRLQRALSLGTLLLLVGTVIMPVLLRSVRVSAQQTPFSVIFVDKSSVIYDGKTYTDVDPYDGDHNYKLNGKQSDCIDQIQIDDFDGSPKATYKKQTLGSRGTCDKQDLRAAIDPTTLSLRNITAYRLADDTIWMPIGGKDPGCGIDSDVDNYVSGHPSYYKNSPKEVNGRPNPDYEKTRYDQTSGEGDVDIWIRTFGDGAGELNIGVGCSGSKAISIKLAEGGATTVPPENVYGKITPTPPGGGGGGDDGTTVDNSGSCESQGGVLNWFICPVIELLDSATNWLDSQIQQLLITPDPTTITGANGNPLQEAWGRIRNFALILLVPLMLIMVIATAMGWSFVDAFSVRRAMPRFLIAIIGISLSWYITAFLITLTNDVGRGTLGLLTQPFGGASASLADMVSVGGAVGAQVGGLLIFGGLVGAGLVSFGIILSLAFVTVLALLLGFVILTLRQLFILILIVFAPLAILAWVFPNTERGWKLWWGNFSKLLLMFPLIMALIASGKIFALIVSQSNIYSGIDNWLKQILVIIAYIAPFFFIPATFKMGGQLFGTISGAVANSTRGIREGQAKYRGGQRAQNLEKVKSGNRFAGGNATNFRGRVNRGLQGVGMVGAAGFNPRRARSKMAAERGLRSFEEGMELLDKNRDIGAVKVDDTLAEAVQLDHSRAAIENRLIASGRFGQRGSAELGQTVETVIRAQRAGSSTAVNSAMAIARAQSGTGYATSADMFESIIQASDGDAALRNKLIGATKSASESARRPDLASPGFVPQAEAVAGLAAGTMTREQVDADMRRAAFDTGAVHQMVGGRNNGFAPLVGQIAHDWDDAMAAGDVEAATELASQVVSLRGAMGSASPQNRRDISALLDHVGVHEGAVDAATGQTYSADEQLGAVISEAAAIRGQGAVNAQVVTQQVRTRAGLYDAGGGNLTPEQLEARRLQQLGGGDGTTT